MSAIFGQEDVEVACEIACLMMVIWLIVILWRKIHFKSNQLCSLLGTWLLPMLYWNSLFNINSFGNTWIVFTSFTLLPFFYCCSTTISGKTPRFVYKWFLFLHYFSYVSVIIGIFLIVLTALLYSEYIVICVNPHLLVVLTITSTLYGLYFGALTREVACYCTDRFSQKIEYTTTNGPERKVLDEVACAVCGSQTESEIGQRVEISTKYLGLKTNIWNEKTYRLECGHIFHENCIRGWRVVGKPQTCPYCEEKIDLQAMFQNPWEKTGFIHGKCMDWIRFLACWYPLGLKLWPITPLVLYIILFLPVTCFRLVEKLIFNFLQYIF